MDSTNFTSDIRNYGSWCCHSLIFFTQRFTVATPGRKIVLAEFFSFMSTMRISRETMSEAYD